MNEIDFVVLWVDSSDLEWQKNRQKYSPDKNDDVSNIRYRDWDNLKYWFRAVEKHAPWVRRIHLVTCGQVPEWLNTNAPKLQLVNHADYMPIEALPSFNSNAIEIGMYRIPGLAEKFVYFNDDIFLTNDVTEDYFFHEGIPTDTAGLTRPPSPIEGDTFSHIISNTIRLINQNFDKKKVICSNFTKWFKPSYKKTLLRTLLNLTHIQESGFVIPHLSTAYLRSDFIRVWEKYESLLRETEFHRFRNTNDLTHFLFRCWRLCEGRYYPRAIKGRYFGVDSISVAKKAAKAILRGSYPEICINDCYTGNDFIKVKNIINSALEARYNQKSAFEL